MPYCENAFPQLEQKLLPGTEYFPQALQNSDGTAAG
jgi:hypothetical protein